jgi:symplekin
MPAQFQSTYTPIAAAGTQAQIRHMARLLAAQLVAAGLGKGVQQQQLLASKKQSELEAQTKQTIGTLVGGNVNQPSSCPSIPVQPPAAPSVQSARKGIIQFKLSNITQPIERLRSDKLATDAIRRILSADKAAQLGNVAPVRSKILTSLVAQFGGQFKEELIAYIFADLRNRSDLAFAWMYQEYANMQGYSVATANADKRSLMGYDNCLTQLLTSLLDRPDQREGLFSRLILEAPLITPNAVEILKKYCQDETRIYLGMTTIKEIILKRPNLKLEFLDILLNFTSHEKPEVRNSAIRVTKKLHERDDLQESIEKYAMYFLKFLLQTSPPSELLTGRIKLESPGVWTEDTIKICLYLFLGLLPVNHKLIHELANIYTAALADIKRTILRILEAPVKGMGMDSPELLLLVENCPRGAETLVTRIIHILTDKAVPSPELVDRVRDLYQKRVSDVRFLIPVLNGLDKKEVIAALPKLIKLNPVVVKEVFNRLLGVHGQENFTSPVSPAELLIALHSIDPTKVDVKTIIKACSLCFAEKSIYTQEVLGIVMAQLMDLNPLPTLLMRTVIQSLAMYPKLIGFIMNIMQRLIVKQVWKNRKVWEGFVKCCQRTKPQSFQVLLQLPAIQLRDVFTLCPELREPLHSHVQSFTPHQRAHIPKVLLSVLEKDVTDEQQTVENARRLEEERLSQQEQLYQQKLDEDRRKQQEVLKQKMEQSVKTEPMYDEDSMNSADVQPLKSHTTSSNLTLIQLKPDTTQNNITLTVSQQDQ